MYEIRETKEYTDWFRKQTKKEQAQIHARLVRIKLQGYFGVAKKLGESLAELKWGNGRRVYFTMAQEEKGNSIILLLGGNKNSQAKDIKKAKLLLQKIHEDK